MKRFLLLARILKKCGKAAEKSEDASDLKGDSGNILLVLGGIALPVLFYMLGKVIGALAMLLGDPQPYFSTLFLLVGFLTLVLALMELIGSLFLSSDLGYLLSLPFSADQIVLARTANAFISKLILTTLIVLPFGVGFATGSGTAQPAGYWVGLVLGDLLLPAVTVAIAAILAMLIMTVFRIARNREMMAVIGALLAFAAWIAYSLVNTGDMDLSTEAVQQTAHAVVSALSGPSAIIPVIPFLSRMMVGQALIPNLLIALGITAAIIVLYLLLSRVLYLKAALNMQDSSGKKRQMDETGWDKTCRAQSVLRAYTRKELRCIFRNPAYLLNGWLMALAWPVLLLSVSLMKSIALPFDMMFEDPQAAGLMRGLYMMAGSLAVAILSACSTVGFSCLSSTLISREGHSFYYMKMFPVPYRVQVLGKRNAVAIVAGIGSVGYELIAGIVLCILGIVDILWVPYCMLLSAALVLLFINLLSARDLKKPNLNWESESAIARTSGAGIIIWLIGFTLALILFLALPAVLIMLAADHVTQLAALIAIGVPVVAIGLALLSEYFFRRGAERKLSAVEG